MNLASRLVAALYIAFSLSGCKAEFDDVSSLPEYRKVIGERCQVKSLNAHGVTLKLERFKITDVIVLTSLNLSGSEITFSNRLPAGTTLEVVAVRKCKNCPFEDRVEYQVLSQPKPKEFGNIPVYMHLQRIAPSAIECNTLRGNWGAA